MDSEWITTESGTTVLGFEYGLRLAVSSPLYHGLYHKGFLFRPAKGRMSEERLWWSGSLCCGQVRVRASGLRKRPPWYPFFCFSLCLPGSPQPHLIGLVGPHFMNRTPYVNFLDVRHNSRFKKKKKHRFPPPPDIHFVVCWSNSSTFERFRCKKAATWPRKSAVHAYWPVE